MRLKWTKPALIQLKAAQDFIAKDNPVIAQKIAQRIADASYLLLTQLKMGRPGRHSGTREWIVKQTPYLIAYQINSSELIILQIIHGKQKWPKEF